MSEFHVEVIEVGKCEKHPNADTLSITFVHGGYPVIFRTGEFNEGDKAIYIPIDAVVPDTEHWAFLSGHRRIKAKKLRGVFSMGMLEKLPDPNLQLGQNVQELLGIEKWEPVIHSGRLSYAENEKDQSFMPIYTDIESWRKHKSVLKKDEHVVITEKIHGANGRWCFRDGKFWVGSHRYLKKEDERDLWWRALHETGLDEKIKKAEGMLFFGEVFGQVQDLKYGHDNSIAVRIFDVFDTNKMEYINFTDMEKLCSDLNIDIVPTLYNGEWTDELICLAEGKTTLSGGHVREGIVIRPITERFERMCGRVILKLVGEGYLLRKNN